MAVTQLVSGVGMESAREVRRAHQIGEQNDGALPAAHCIPPSVAG